MIKVVNLVCTSIITSFFVQFSSWIVFNNNIVFVLQISENIKERRHETTITIQSKINFRKWKMEKSYYSTNIISRHKIIFPFDIQLYYCVRSDINLWKIVILPMNINFVAFSWHLRLYRVGIIKKLFTAFSVFTHATHLARERITTVRFGIVFLYTDVDGVSPRRPDRECSLFLRNVPKKNGLRNTSLLVPRQSFRFKISWH